MIEEQCREWNTDNGISKPPPYIDEALPERFTELEIQAVTHSRYTMKCEQRQRLSCRQNILASMPSEFTTLRQARTTLHLIIMRQIHWSADRGTTPDGGCMIPTIIDGMPFNNESGYRNEAEDSSNITNGQLLLSHCWRERGAQGIVIC